MLKFNIWNWEYMFLLLHLWVLVCLMKYIMLASTFKKGKVKIRFQSNGNVGHIHNCLVLVATSLLQLSITWNANVRAPTTCIASF